MKTIQVRGVPDDVHAALRARAAAQSMSLSSFALTQLERVAAHPPLGDVLERARSRHGVTSGAAVVAAVRDGRERSA